MSPRLCIADVRPVCKEGGRWGEPKSDVCICICAHAAFSATNSEFMVVAAVTVGHHKHCGRQTCKMPREKPAGMSDDFGCLHMFVAVV